MLVLSLLTFLRPLLSNSSSAVSESLDGLSRAVSVGGGSIGGNRAGKGTAAAGRDNGSGGKGMTRGDDDDDNSVEEVADLLIAGDDSNGGAKTAKVVPSTGLLVPGAKVVVMPLAIPAYGGASS
ncbi:hypothetical protein N7465_012004 [Penicillium sp. CMV-2018d]|nr:hypothetical protein N7465_012004 [Penicillium sp. CMV-2018d]